MEIFCCVCIFCNASLSVFVDVRLLDVASAMRATTRVLLSIKRILLVYKLSKCRVSDSVDCSVVLKSMCCTLHIYVSLFNGRMLVIHFCVLHSLDIC